MSVYAKIDLYLRIFRLLKYQRTALWKLHKQKSTQDSVKGGNVARNVNGCFLKMGKTFITLKKND